MPCRFIRLLLVLCPLLAGAQAFTPMRPFVFTSSLVLSPPLTNYLDYYWACEISQETNYVTGNLPLHETFVVTNGVVSNGIVCPGVVDSADIPVTYWTNHSWTVCGWFRVSGWNTFNVLAGIWLGGNDSWLVTESASVGLMNVYFYDKNSAAILFQKTLSPSYGWNFWSLGYNPTNNECWVQVNGGFRTTQTLADTLKYQNVQLDCGGHFTGAMDEFGVWGRTLSPSEVGWLYNGGNGRSWSELQQPYYTNDYQAIALVSDWTNRIAQAGGSVPSSNTLNAASAFFTGINSTSISNKLLECAIFVPDSLTAATTPLIRTYGCSPWTNNNFVAGDLNSDGLRGFGTSAKYLHTGMVPSQHYNSGWAMNNSGASVYVAGTLTNDVSCCFGSTASDGATALEFFPDIAGTLYCDWPTGNSSQSRITGANSTGGFFTMSRNAANSVVLYKANSSIGFTTWGTNSYNNGASDFFQTNDKEIVALANNLNGTVSHFCGDRISFMAFHNALTPVEASNLWFQVQTLRTNLGGGYQ